MYQGPVETVPEFSADCGHDPNPPRNYNPADWIMKVAQSVDLKQLSLTMDSSPSTNAKLAMPLKETNSSGRDDLGLTSHWVGDDVDDRPVSFATELTCTYFYHDTGAFAFKFGLSIFLGILIE
jgi:hypothetical protein